MFKLHPLFLSLVAAQGVFIPASTTMAATLKPFSPYVNDNKVGVFCVCNGSTQTLSGNQQFSAGLSGAQSLTLRELQSQVSNPDISLALAPGLDPGGRDYAIEIPDWEQGGYKTIYVYNSNGMTETAPLGLDTPLPNYVPVEGGQYINTRVAQVSKGTINVDIGQKGAATTAETNGWSMAAKQSRLFTATGSGNMNWNSANRLTFTSVLPPYGGPYLTYDVDNVAFYKGAFSVTTTDNVTTDFNVTSFEEFKSYNDWLILQLESSRLDPDSYSAELDKAVTITSGQIVYGKVLQDYDDDEAAQPIGELVVLSADGKKATARVNGTLEVANASSAVLAANGATAIINGKVASTSNGAIEGDALSLTGASTGINKGVINGGFFNNADGKGVDSSSVGQGVNAVRLLDKSKFTNNGVINVAGSGTGLGIFDGSATNNGNINVGVSDYSSSASGVFVNGEGASFVNAASGTIYLGRSPQNSLKDKTTDTRVYDSVGINMVTDGSAVNQGRIVIGSLTQSSVAMQVENGPNARLQNSGVIDVNGRDNLQPEENVAMAVIDSGTGGRVGNSGTINLNGDNGTGLKVIATSGNQSSAYSSGTINVIGNADPLSSNTNTAVWAKGEEGGKAYAKVTGKINLTGTGAVGIRAEGNATVDNTQSISLRNAEYQTGYLAIGSDAKINYGDSSTYGTYGKASHSTIFRVEDGADFNGSSGLTLEPHTAYSTGIAASGSGSEVKTNGAAFDIGENATGVSISNGASGTLNNGTWSGQSRATRIHLSGSNATGATVDGEGSTLISNASITDELRSNGGELGVVNGDGSRIPVNETGLLATNKASLTNTGRINLYGEATAIRAESGATVNNSAHITIWNNSVGLYAKGNYDEGDGVTPTVITNTGIVDLSRLVYPSIGVVADGPLAQIYQNGNIYISDRDAVGGKAINGGKIFVGEAGTVEFSYSSDGQTGYWADGNFSTITSNGGKTTIYDTASTVYRLTNGAWFESINPAEIDLSYGGSVGLDASGGSYVAATDIFNLGYAAKAIKLSSGASATITNPIALEGDSSTAVAADGETTSAYNISTISGAGAEATAYDMSNGAIVSLAQGSSVNLTGRGSTAFRVTNGGSVFNQGYVNVANGVGIDVIGGRTQYFPESAQIQAGGTAAMRVGSDGTLAVYGDGTFRNQITGTNGADAILLDTGAKGLSIEGTTITAEGGGSAIDNRAEISNISLASTYIYARGAGSSGIRSATSFDGQGTFVIEPSNGATGYIFANADGSTTSNDLVSHGTILAGSGSNGIQANTTGKVISEGNIYVTTETGGSAIVTNTASEVINRGEIFSWSTEAPVIDLRGGTTTFINEGTIGAQYPDTVIVAGGATSNQIALVSGAVVGDVNTGEGTDTVALTGGTINGSLTMGSGVDNRAYVQNVSLADVSHITTAGGEGSTLSLSEIAASGGSFASDDLSRGVNLGAGWSTINFYNTGWTLTDNLKLAHSTINIDAASTLYAGDNVNPVLAGATNDSLVVNNAGTLDLTNGAGSPGNTLTIDGTLNSLYGKLKLASAINGGTSQSSDTLRVTGDANGVTLIEVTPAAGSTGALSDLNQNGVTEANEGISLAQVAGSASASSFALQGGYLAAGPWRYDLYSFAPGSSDASQRLVDGSGNQFWDYRLANAFVSNGSSTRAAVVPQVPSYVSAPVGLAYYSAATLNDLHNRLGELRQDQGQSVGGEMFLRYTGANMRYSTSRSFNDFGYNFDMDYSAMQVGGNVLHLDGANGTLRGGVAYTRGNSRISPDAADGYSSTSFDSDTLSLYSTWLQESGFYLDGTLSYSWHRGETDIARKKDVAKIKGKGWSASLESGYPFELGSGLRLEPQAQLTYLHLGLDNFSDKDNLAVRYDDYNQTIGRVGAKLDRRWSDDSGRQYTPYLRTNYYKGWGSEAKTKVGAKGVEGLDQSFSSGKFGQMWDAGVGGTVTFRNNVSLYAEADYRKEIDGNGGKGWGYNAGVKWTF
ncbi:autotransporter outer membrane beta-barrel domain-containing protein [Kalamiella sp. sgz302252]|uniref:autotransporter outer membrane beta-barrel domain-containing protein n=1 Tax=Pantoea sp. sgz302252 TaxID=3341827 RepID=UPI0036D3A657